MSETNETSALFVSIVATMAIASVGDAGVLIGKAFRRHSTPTPESRVTLTFDPPLYPLAS